MRRNRLLTSLIALSALVTVLAGPVSAQCSFGQMLPELGTSARFARFVAMTDDYLIASAYFAGPNEVGQVRIYDRHSAGLPLDGVVSGTGFVNSGFGFRLAAYGDRFVTTGRVFQRTETGWTLEDELNAPGSSDYESVTMHDELIISGRNDGVDYFRLTEFPFSNNWVYEGPIVPSGPEPNGFGHAVDFDGSSLIVGADFADQAFIFEWDGNSFTQVATLTQQGSDYAAAVAIEGDLAVVGAPGVGSSNAGSAWVYERTAGVWSTTPIGLVSTGPSSDNFGETVGIADRTIVVSARSDVELGSGVGAFYVFRQSGSTWAGTKVLPPLGLSTPNGFGFALDVDDTHAFVGSVDESATSPDSGGSSYWLINGIDCDENGQLDVCQLASGQTVVATPGGPCDAYVRGDKDGDAFIAIGDAINLLGVIFDDLADLCPAASDANGDGSIDIGDSIFLLTFLFGAGTPPPAPYPDCGVDPLLIFPCPEAPCP